MKRAEASLQSFLTSALAAYKLSAPHLGRFMPEYRAPRYTLNGRLGGSQSQSGRLGGETNLLPSRESNHDSSSDAQPVA
jgi:hypothetical protein